MKQQIKLTKNGVQYMGLGGLITDVFGGGNTYNAGLAPTTQLNYAPTVGTAGANSLAGYGQYNQNLGNENQLASALLNNANGMGPNPAQATLNQNTGANVANTAALIAGARGASSNPGLMARQIAQQGAGIQQQGVGQAATLEAQQQLGAEQALGGLYGQVGSQIQGEQGVNNNLFTGAAGANNAQNNTSVANTGQMNQVNSGVSGENATLANGLFNGVAQAAGGAGASLLTSSGGAGGGASTGGMAAAAGLMAGGGTVPDHFKKMASIYHPDMPLGPGKTDFKSGGKVPGEPKVKGNSLKNDTVPAMLSPGEVVIPKSIMESENAPEKARDFVAEELRKKGMGNSDEADDFKTALQRHTSGRKKK